MILPWGDWLVALAVSLREPILTILRPIITAYIIRPSARSIRGRPCSCRSSGWR
ncbi:protein of unknown function [Methylorubrum extorquens]|uniref:Uncharacterized protein n=1 Tax=Methylorubrum extorquens TaxID=408 RepID=A0A2N9AXN2_METEX|nr:protein of unknown function [Methylorubrum extorquens]